MNHLKKMGQNPRQNQKISTDKSKLNTNSRINNFLELSQEVESGSDVSSLTPLLHLDQSRKSSRAKRHAPPMRKRSVVIQ